MTLRRVSTRAFALVVVHCDGVGATAADDRVRSSHPTSRNDESILSAGRSLHLDVKFLAATGAMKVVPQRSSSTDRRAHPSALSDAVTCATAACSTPRLDSEDPNIAASARSTSAT